ncbi:molybdopterin-dependent oxidoreductase [Alkalilimnicola ehrlichii MLHE-1]|uniref:Assimilatory nitrate reductase (NADH) alpha subunit apoprotein n=1 Tax=Alkalilimnicola ehrlichii (strain ATCC BAA-1101 / DSM 17681 / MLHE-1) TaxID=187272 RepID=Q0A7Y9_ALKEH|nr:nitrate reductase [Alkalilimnicola ehrlichii]ABI57048.1 assimilatory nitrate reductase (NADH) alpha subunit apoprotein [Alkalilimnicola ehrlichii MLHE-1]
MNTSIQPPRQPGEVHTTCPYCGVGCGVLARMDKDNRVHVRGDPEHPANFGRLCSKGAALGETTGLNGRLLHPRVHGQRTDWDTALATVADGLNRVIRRDGPEAVGFYVSGQLLTEDYYVANKLMKGYIGSANIDTNSRLCMASSVAGHIRAFGEDLVPGCYEDLERADLVVLTGSNLAWCHPVLYQRLEAARARRPGMRVVVIDPRETETAAQADLHLPLRPGSDVALWNGLFRRLVETDQIHRDIRPETEAADSNLKRILHEAGDADAVASACDLNPRALHLFYDWFAGTERTVSVYSQGVNQSSQGTDKVNAIINVHILTGRLGRPGCGPFSVTGQPNAMGGREVGGLSNQLAAHMGFSQGDRIRVQRYWDSPRIARQPGMKAVELFRAAAQGRVKALWIMATNPVVSLPDADLVKRALARCELVVVSDCIANTDTTGYAHVLMPAAAWGEKSGTVTNSERCISRQRAFRTPAGEARPDWWIISQVARLMGFDRGFAYGSPREIFDEHARLTAVHNPGPGMGGRTLHLGALAGMNAKQWDTLQPVQWPCPGPGLDTAGPGRGTQRLATNGGLPTEDGHPRLHPVCAETPGNTPDARFPLVLNTGRTRDHWHTLTRTGLSVSLSTHQPEPRCDLHPEDATRFGLADGHLVRVRSAWGSVLLRARYQTGQRRGELFVPMHWNDCYAAQARIGAVANPITDPISGQPELKHTPVAVEAVPAAAYGFVLSRADDLPPPETAYWVRINGHAHQRFVFASTEAPDSWRDWAGRWLGTEGTVVEMADRARGVYRFARLVDDRLVACLFIAADPAALPGCDWLAGLLDNNRPLGAEERLALLAGRPAGEAETGETVCACFGVGERIIESAVAAGAHDTEAVTRHCKAGGYCGSCRPAINAIIQRLARSAA